MAKSIYIRLAVTNLKNNRKTYVPYMLTSILTILMCYIMEALYRNSDLEGSSVKDVLWVAVGVIPVFAVIFLFYTNSFLIKRRKKEIGVYNILGMGKRHIAIMMTVETLITAAAGIIGGLAGGIVFSKLMYLILLKMLRYDVGMHFTVSLAAIQKTTALFAGIFILTLIYNLFQIRLANPVELLRGGNVGEREPKTRWLLALFGVLALGTGYTIALKVESPLTAIYAFFVAVICVILGTYALFVAGSIAFLKILRKNKKYYYRTKHFTSVSGMIYRMKQNAVGLANICILSTMVLVMLSTTVCLYMGMSDILSTRFPRELRAIVYNTSPEKEEQLDRIVEKETEELDITRKSELRYRGGTVAAIRKGDNFAITSSSTVITSEGDISELYLIPLEEYNRMEGTDISLDAGEALICSEEGSYGKEKLQIGNASYQVKEELKEISLKAEYDANFADIYFVVLPQDSVVQAILKEGVKGSERGEDYIRRMGNLRYTVEFDLEGDGESCRKAHQIISDQISGEMEDTVVESRELSRKNFYELYGGFLFIGIYLGLLFLMATVLIIYYKQISEGYDDKERYQIMQKVGMSKREVRSSIRSQVLTVFFLPLAAAVIHISVAFPVITKILSMFNMDDGALFFQCTVVTVAVFAVFYGIVFGITAREYYKIVD